MEAVLKILKLIKPILPLVIIVGVLQLTGQLENVVSMGQSAILKTGIFNAGTELEMAEDFDFTFQAVSLDGQILNMDSLRNKVVFLNLWATWCGPCRAEMPTIQSLYDDIKDPNIVFLILSVDRIDAEKRVTDYIKAYNYTFPVYILNGQPTEQIHVPTLPTTFVISKDGKIIRIETGMKNYDTEQFKKFLLKQASR